MAIGTNAMKLAAGLAVCCAATAGIGCGGVDPEAQALAENGSDVSDLVARVSGLTASFALGAGSTFDLGAVAATATLYSPAGCVTTSTGAESVTLTFASCSGPWGLVKLSGSVTVGPPPGSAAPDMIEVSATHLAMDQARVSFSAQASIRSTGPAARVLTWNPAISGVTARGRSFNSEGNWSVAWTLGGTCIDVTSMGDQAIVETSPFVIEQATGLKRCSANCPTAGTLVVSNQVSSGPLSERITFDGKDIVPFSGSSGNSDIQLACGL
jgi:hypothetical protein